MRIAARLILLFRLCPLAKEWRRTDNGHTDNEKPLESLVSSFQRSRYLLMLCRPAASMPTAQKLYLMMFVGKCSCTSHVLQYSSSRSYEHSRSLQSSLCSGAVTVLIRWALLHVFSPRQSWCEHHFVRMAWRKRSFFVEALLNLHKFGKRQQNYTLFHKPPNNSVSFLHIRSIFVSKSFTFSQILCTFAPESIKSSHLRMDSPTERAARAEPNMFELCRVAREEEH